MSVFAFPPANFHLRYIGFVMTFPPGHDYDYKIILDFGGKKCIVSNKQNQYCSINTITEKYELVSLQQKEHLISNEF